MSSEGKRWTIWSDAAAISYVEGPATGGRIEVVPASRLVLAKRVIERHRVQKDDWRFEVERLRAAIEKHREENERPRWIDDPLYAALHPDEEAS